MRGVTDRRQHVDHDFGISTHTPHARRDAPLYAAPPPERAFLLTRLMRGVTISPVRPNLFLSFLLTRLMRGVTEQVGEVGG